MTTKGNKTKNCQHDLEYVTLLLKIMLSPSCEHEAKGACLAHLFSPTKY